MLKCITYKMVVYYFFLLPFLSNFMTVKSELLYQKENLCDPNKLTREECSLNFLTAKAKYQNCEPNKFIFIDCNVCRCGFDGKVDKSQCTKHKCNNSYMKSRRIDPIIGRCEPNHWYQLSKCHLCYCVNNHKLICNSNNTREKVILGEYTLYDCGEKLIKDLSKLVHPQEMLLRSVTKNERSRTINKSLKTKALPKTAAEQTSIPKTIFLTHDKSLISSKSREDKTGINMDIIEIKFRNFNDEDFASTEKDTKSGRFIDLFKNDERYDKSALNSNSIELNQDLSEDSIHESRFDDSFFGLDDTPFKVLNETSLINDLMTTSLNIDLSNVLDIESILSLAVRKSLVSIGAGNKCKPGSTVTDGCNTCFCLANGKSLCTKKMCE